MQQKMNPAVAAVIIAVLVSGALYAGWALIIKPQQQTLPNGMSRADVDRKMKEHYGGGEMGSAKAPIPGRRSSGAPTSGAR